MSTVSVKASTSTPEPSRKMSKALNSPGIDIKPVRKVSVFNGPDDVFHNNTSNGEFKNKDESKRKPSTGFSGMNSQSSEFSGVIDEEESFIEFNEMEIEELKSKKGFSIQGLFQKPKKQLTSAEKKLKREETIQRRYKMYRVSLIE